MLKIVGSKSYVQPAVNHQLYYLTGVLAAESIEPLSKVPFAAPFAAPAATPRPPPQRLTAREREVLCLLAEGLTDKQIATRLMISPYTVNIHVQAIYRKLGVHSRAAATHAALKEGLL